MHPHPRSAGVIGPVIALLLLLLLSSDPVYAADGGNTYHTTFTTITYKSADDLHAFTRNIGSGLPFFSSEFGKDPRLTAKRVDNLVLRAMALLDMRMPNLRFSLTIHPDDREIRTAYAMCARGKGTPVAYYDHDRRTIFVSANTVSDTILAHEIAHAVICAWSASPLPASTQEVLANYVEQHLLEK